MATKHLFKIEVTDTYGGEANYSWVKRYEFLAVSALGAMQMLAVAYYPGWKKDYDTGDMARYNLKGACICAFVEHAE